jgi:hypothetical protein
MKINKAMATFTGRSSRQTNSKKAGHPEGTRTEWRENITKINLHENRFETGDAPRIGFRDRKVHIL